MDRDFKRVVNEAIAELSEAYPTQSETITTADEVRHLRKRLLEVRAAPALRKGYRFCPECGAHIQEGLDHEVDCRYYDYEREVAPTGEEM